MSDANPGELKRDRMSLPEYLRHHFTDTQRYLIIWIATGIACGLAAVAFHKAIQLLFDLVKQFAAWLGGGFGPMGYVYLGLAPMIGGLVSGLILVYGNPEAAGSGIPRTKAQYFRNFGVIPFREAVYRFIVGTISVGSGMSLGREGPTVHLCSAIASKIGQMAGLAKKRVQAMVPLGMGAGISAAFNTPMAAVFFVFEELIGDFSSKSFFGIFITVVIAAAVQRLIIGEHPAFDIELGILVTDWWMLLAIPLGVLSALFGRGFIEAILRTRDLFRNRINVPAWFKPAIGGLSVGLIGSTVAWVSDGNLGVFGIGYGDLNDALNGRILVITLVAMLLFGKMIATVLAYGSGGSGGLFAPTLFIGGMLGALVGLIAQPVFNFSNEIVGAMALLGMGAFFAAVIRCPMTSIVIIWEMTGQYALILPLMVGNMLAWLISGKLQPVPLYDALLLQDKITLKKMPHYKGDQDWRNLPVSTIMTFDPVVVDGASSIEESLVKIRKDGNRHHAYPVMLDNRLCGMITHHELEESIRTRPARKVEELVRGQKLITLLPENSIRDVAHVLVMEDVLQAPVVSSMDAHKVLGIVTLHDIARQQNAIDDSLGR